jgi:DNA (cytosine-5)-methyltransferase 1
MYARYFKCRWCFELEDTVIPRTKLLNAHSHDPKQVFLSEERNDNLLGCIVSKIKIMQVDPNVSALVQKYVACLM